MRVTLATILADEEYDPMPGTEYEVVPLETVTLKTPTIALGKKLYDMVGKDDVKDLDVLRMVCDGPVPETPEETVPLVAARAVEDFFSLLGLIGNRLTQPSEK